MDYGLRGSCRLQSSQKVKIALRLHCGYNDLLLHEGSVFIWMNAFQLKVGFFWSFAEMKLFDQNLRFILALFTAGWGGEGGRGKGGWFWKAAYITLLILSLDQIRILFVLSFFPIFCSFFLESLCCTDPIRAQHRSKRVYISQRSFAVGNLYAVWPQQTLFKWGPLERRNASVLPPKLQNALQYKPTHLNLTYL